MASGAPRVVLADDDVLLREGVASLLERSGYEVVDQAGNAQRCSPSFARTGPIS
jgi:DNA-binding NarL/FixJ family response regulator